MRYAPIKHHFDTVANQANVLVSGASVSVFKQASQELAADSFNRPDQNPINTNWKLRPVPGYALGQVSGGKYIGQSNKDTDMVYDGGISWPPDQYSQATLVTLTPNSGYAVLLLRCDSTTQAGYVILLDTFFSGGFGTATDLNIFAAAGKVAHTTVVPRLGDVFKASIVGSVISVYQNGVLSLQYNDPTPVVSGKPGLAASTINGPASGIAWTNWSGGGTNSVQSLATLFSDDGFTTKANPVITDANGRFDFYVADGRYDIQVSGPGISTFTQSNVEILDATEANSTDANWQTQVLGFENQAINPTPPSGFVNLYSKSLDKNLYFKDDTGREVQLASGGPQTMDTIPQGNSWIKQPYVQGPIPIVYNGNFEVVDSTQTTNVIDGWVVNSSMTAVLDTVNPFEGLNSLKCTCNTAQAAVNGSYAYPVTVGDSWTIRGAIRSDGSTLGTIALVFLDKNGTALAPSTAIKVQNSSTSWLFSSATGTVPSGAVMATISTFNGSVFGGPVTFWADAIEVFRASGTPYSGGSGGSGTVTNVGLATPFELNVSGSPVTTAGTLTTSWANENPNTVFAGTGGNSIAGVVDDVVTATGLAGTVGLTLTPGTNNELAWFLVQALNSSQSSPIAAPSGWTNQNSNGNNAAVFSKVLSSTAPLAVSTTLANSASWAALGFTTAVATSPVIVQKLTAGGFFSPPFNLGTFASSVTPGNAILAIFMGTPPSGLPFGTFFSDNQGNVYTPFGYAQNGAGEIITAAMSIGVIGGSTTVFLGTSNNIGMNGGAFLFEVSGLVAPSLRPIFRALLPPDIPAISLASSGRGGVFGNLPTTNLNSGTGANSATFWRGDGQWSVVPAPSIPNTVLLFSNNSIGTTTIGNTSTTVKTTTLTMPPTGGPYRAFINYSLYLDFTGITNQPNIDFWVNDGISNMAGVQTGQSNAASGAKTSATYGGFSTNTYSNGASVTFTLFGIQPGAAGATVQGSPASGSGPGSSFQIAIVSSN